MSKHHFPLLLLLSAWLMASNALAQPAGQVVAWEDNYHGITDVPAAAQSGVVAIGMGGDHMVALKNDGSVVAWGDNTYGQTNVPVAAQRGVIAVAANVFLSLALKNDGSVVAWGINPFFTSGEADVPVTAQSGVTAIAAGIRFSVALKIDGSVVAWGDNRYGQTNVPAAAQSGVVAVAAGFAEHAVALKNDGTVVAWGLNGDGQTNVPTGLTGVTAIAAGLYNTMALRGSGWDLGAPLALRPSTNAMILSWPANATGFTLQSTPNLAPPVTWLDVTNPPAPLGGQFTVTNPMSSPAQVFRLRKP